MVKDDVFRSKISIRVMSMYLNSSEEVEVKFSDDKAWLVNKEYGTEPLVAHGNGPSKVYLPKV